jgi:MOSC domain-containing protein YiiM
MSHERHPGWSRWYAAVREPGVIRPGDPVEVLVSATSI